jgi:cytochrome c peroxidase
LRRFIDQRVGGLEKLMVSENNEDLRQSLDPRFQITEAKRYLGKQLYFDPVRATNIQPEFGGVLSTAQTASCGSCHLGEAAGKAGTVLNLAVGAEGRGYTDARAIFHPRRRILPGFVDTIPTPTEIFEGGVLVASGRFDAVDSVPRLSPSMIGFGFNNRLLLGGKAGEPSTSPGASNPDNLPAAENLAQIAISVHRMFETQAAVLQQIPAYVKLFQDAFPDEAVQAALQSDLDLLINDDTISRAIATFLRTVVTRNTPWDRFLAGDNNAMTVRQRRGARLFFTDASHGGAGCVSCHSGPMLNKQLGDEAGLLVEENFYNIGIGDHPLQELNTEVLQDPLHHDIGRLEITGIPGHDFTFRVLTLRQLKDGRQFMHNASFSRVRDVVEYFNDGVPQDPTAAAAGTLTPKFTHPRGPGSPPGLGLTHDQVADLTEFLEKSLYDPTFVRFNPNSTTDTFELNERDLAYSVFRPDLAALGAIDGRQASGLPTSNDDALSRRDKGLEFLDVTSQLQVTRISIALPGRRVRDIYHIQNNTGTIVDTHLLMVAQGLPDGIEMLNGSGVTTSTPAPGDPYHRVFLPEGVLLPGQSIVRELLFRRERHAPAVQYTLTLLSGQGTP